MGRFRTGVAQLVVKALPLYALVTGSGAVVSGVSANEAPWELATTLEALKVEVVCAILGVQTLCGRASEIRDLRACPSPEEVRRAGSFAAVRAGLPVTRRVVHAHAALGLVKTVTAPIEYEGSRDEVRDKLEQVLAATWLSVREWKLVPLTDELERQYRAMGEDRGVVMKNTEQPGSRVPKATRHITEGHIVEYAKWVALRDLDDNPVQPKRRTTDSAMREIRAQLTHRHRAGEDVSAAVEPVAVLRSASRYVVCNGHRRVLALRELGYMRIRVDIWEGVSPQALWYQLNGLPRAIKGQDNFTAWALTPAKDRADFLARLGPSTVGQIKDCINVFGLDRALQIARDEKQGPGVGCAVLVLCGRLERAFGETRVTKRAVGEWMVEHGQQRPVHEYFRRFSRDAKMTNACRWLLDKIKRNVCPDYTKAPMR